LKGRWGSVVLGWWNLLMCESGDTGVFCAPETKSDSAIYIFLQIGHLSVILDHSLYREKTAL
jgi:hypothetical protein